MTDELKAKIEDIRKFAGKIKKENQNIYEAIKVRSGEMRVTFQDDNSLNYIAAVNPQTMLEILAYIDRLEKEHAVEDGDE